MEYKKRKIAEHIALITSGSPALVLSIIDDLILQGAILTEQILDFPLERLAETFNKVGNGKPSYIDEWNRPVFEYETFGGYRSFSWSSCFKTYDASDQLTNLRRRFVGIHYGSGKPIPFALSGRKPVTKINSSRFFGFLRNKVC